MFSGCAVLSDITNTELGSSNQEVYLSAGKITGVDLVSCCAWKLVPTAISGSVDISEAPGCHFLQQIISQWGSQKLLQGLVSHELTAYLSFFDPFLTKWIMAILSNEWKPGTFESHNSLQLSFEVLQQIFEVLIQILLNVNLSWIKLSWIVARINWKHWVPKWTTQSGYLFWYSEKNKSIKIIDNVVMVIDN